MPAYILTKKQKSIKVFFDLLNVYYTKNVSIEKLWKYFDKSNHFKTITTLRKYFSILISQLNEILKSLTGKIFKLKGNDMYYDILPDKNLSNTKLKSLFDLITKLLKLLHEMNIQIFLESEISFFLNYFLFTESKIYLLKDP